MKLKENRINYFSWLVYGIITLIAVLKHEPNRDEAQVWLIARDLSIPQLFAQINSEGHPCLWYFIVWPFAKLGFPYFIMQLIHWFIAIITTGIFLFKAPLNKLFKLLFVFSYFMIYQYSVVARNYCIVILFLFLIATFYERRFTRPYLYAFLLLALYNTHVLAFGGAVALTIIYFMEAKANGELSKLKFPLLIMIAGAITVVLQLFPYAHATGNALIQTNYLPHLNINTWWIVLTSIQNAFIPIDSQYEEMKVGLFFALILIAFFVANIRKTPVFIFLLITYGWILYVFSTIHSGSLKHQGLILIFIVFTLWVSRFYLDKENSISKLISRYINNNYMERSVLLVISMCLFVNVIYGLSTIRKEYNYQYSGAKDMSDYILNNNLQTNEIACYRSWRATAVAPYLPQTKFWFPDRGEYGSFFKLDSIFDKDGNSLSDLEVIKRTQKKYNKEALLLLNYPLTILPDSSFNCQLLFQNEKLTWGTDDENFLLYKLVFTN